MYMVDMVKDKIKRHKIPKGSGAKAKSNGIEPNGDQYRQKSSRAATLRKRPTVVETMESTADPSEKARSTLGEHFRLAGESAADSDIKLAGASVTYRDERKKLLATECEHTWDAPARKRASPVELKAGEILVKIRENERIDPGLFGNLPSEAVPDSSTRDMGGRFLVNKARIQQSRVFKIANHMPKGAHLHLHFNSELPPERLFPHARSPGMEDTMFIRCTTPLIQPKDFLETEIVFSVLRKDTRQGNIFAADYNPDWKASDSASWMRWVDFRRQFPKHIPIENGVQSEEQLDAAEQWAREKMIVTLEQAYSDRQTTNGAWACFNQGTRAFKGLLNYESVYRWYIGHAVDSMIRDKVMYAELRPMLLDPSIPSDDGTRSLNHEDQMNIICEEIEKKQDELRTRNELHLFPFGIKIIYSTPRSIPRPKMKSELENCIKLKLQFRDLICGFDLVGAEDRPNHIGYYADLLVAFTNACKELGVSIPFMFHAGETLIDTGGSHNPCNSNLYDSLLLNAKRIGHGYSLLKHPLLVEKYKAQNICLELCPISNELLHLCGNARQHIFPELLAAGLHCTLNADNPSLYRGASDDSSSLSYEFYQVMVGDPRMNIHGWKQLAEWSIEHSSLKHDEKAQAQRILSKEWEKSCQWVVDTYGEYANGLKDLVGIS